VLGIERRLSCCPAHTNYAAPAPTRWPAHLSSLDSWSRAPFWKLQEHMVAETGQTRQSLYVKLNTVARSCNVYTSSGILTAWNRWTCNERSFGGFMSPETVKRTWVFAYNFRYVFPILSKCGFSLHICIRASDIKFHVNPSSGGEQTARETVGRIWLS